MVTILHPKRCISFITNLFRPSVQPQTQVFYQENAVSPEAEQEHDVSSKLPPTNSSHSLSKSMTRTCTRELDLNTPIAHDDDDHKKVDTLFLSKPPAREHAIETRLTEDGAEHGSVEPQATQCGLERKHCLKGILPAKLADRDGPFVLFSCYPFIEADSLRYLSPKDVSFLFQRGCFHLPARTAFEEFIKEYFCHVHPILPLLNEADFWNKTLYRPGSPSEEQSLSLFLLQAILFISCPVG